jgi:type IX secretion system PorP/SprF family membrane protein
MKPISCRFFIKALIILFCGNANSQDIEFSQFYATKNYLNPAFSALSNDQSFTTSYRNQWPSIANAYDSYFVSYDRKIKNKEAGVGVYYLSDVAGAGALKRQSFVFQYAKHLRFGKEIYGSLGVKGGYNLNSIQWDKLTWGDMIDARKGFVYSTNQPQGSSNESYFDAGAGLIIYTDKYFGGFAIEHINRPNVGLLSLYEESKLPIRYKVHGGAKIPVQASPNATAVILSPQMIYTKQGNSQQLSVGSYITSGQFSIGVWHRLKDSFIVLAGIDHNSFRFGYSFDLGSNKLMVQSGGAHEISMTYNFDFHSKQKTRKFRVIYCPSF